MPSHRRPPPPVAHPRRWWVIAVADGALVLAVVVALGHNVAPKVAADSVSLPERSPELSGHGGLLAPLSIGVVASEPASNLEVGAHGASGVGSAPRDGRPAERPSAARGTVRVSPSARPAPASAPSATQAVAAATSTPTVTEQVQAATTALPPVATTPPETTTAASATPAATTTDDTTPASVTTEPSDVIGGLINDPTGTSSSEETAP